MVMPSMLFESADLHNIGNTQTSWLDVDSWTQKLGNAGKMAATSILSGANSFYNTAVTVGNWLGADGVERDTQNWISAVDSDLGIYYRQNKETADLLGFVAGSFIPGLGGVKIFNAGQKALMAGIETGKIGGNIGRAAGLLLPKTEHYLDLAKDTINNSQATVRLLNANTVKALASGVYQNVLEATAGELLITATMFKSPTLENSDVWDITTNIGIGAGLGGVVGGAFSSAKIIGSVKKSIREEDVARFPFVSRPSFAERTSPAERILLLSEDIDFAQRPAREIDALLLKDKITANKEGIRSSIHELAGDDKTIANMLANASDGLGHEQMFANFLGTSQIGRAGSSMKTITKLGRVPESNQYVALIGENVGKILDREPAFLSIADHHIGVKAVKDVARSYEFKLNEPWNPTTLAVKNAPRESEARYIWAEHILSEIKKGTRIHENDIPLLQRAYKDSMLDIEIVSSDGLTTTRPASREELFNILKDRKEAVAIDLIQKNFAVQGENTAEAVAKITNVKQSYLEGTHSGDLTSDLFAHESAKLDYLQMLQSKGFSLGAEEAIDPMFLPKYARISYTQDPEIQGLSGTVLDGLAILKGRQKIYESQAKNVVATVLGRHSEGLADISPARLATANRNGSGAGLFSSENANYGTLGSTMAQVGSVTRAAQEDFRKAVSQALEAPLVALGRNLDAALEFDSINQKITRSAKQWRLAETTTGDTILVENRLAKQFADIGEPVDYEMLEEGINAISIKNRETLEALRAHISVSRSHTIDNKLIRAAQGHTDSKDEEVFRPIRPSPTDYQHVAFVKDDKVTGTGHTTMIFAASERELAGLVDRAQRIPGYRVITKGQAEDYARARGEYEYSRTLHENYLNTDLNNRGIYSNFFPKTDPQKIVNDILQQHYRDSDILVKEAVRLRYESTFSWLEDMGKRYSKLETSKIASSRELIETTANNPYFNYIKTALNVSKLSENHLLYGFNKLLDDSFSKVVGSIRNAWNETRTPQDLDKVNSILDQYGMKPAYYDAALSALANHTAPRGELTKFVRGANAILSRFVLGLDPLNALNNAIGSNVLRMTELRYLTNAIRDGNAEAAGELAGLAKISLPGTGDQVLAPTKLVAGAISNFWRASRDDPASLLARFKADGFDKTRIDQLKLLVDDFTLTGTEKVSDLSSRLQTGFQRAKNQLSELGDKGEKITGNVLAEQFNRFVSWDVARQLTDIGIKHGLLDEATAKAYRNTFVNRVEGHTIASQRPLIFQGPIGQAIGLFQSYQFNLLQQLFRYVAEGEKKDLAMLLGMQSTLYGVQSLPAFQFVNTHILGQLSGNKEHRDAYDLAYGALGKTAGEFFLYGLPSNLIHGNIYSRGDINPRQITVLPTTLQEIPIVQGWGRFLVNMKETVSKMAGGGDVWQSILQGMEHNGISRPLAGFAQTLQGIPSGTAFSTSNKGSILYSNDLFSWASVVRLAGGRPLDEAVVNDAMFRVRTYEAARRKDMMGLAETVKSSLIGGNEPSSESVTRFAERYAELGGKQSGFNKWMMNLYKGANESQASQLERSLKDPFSYKIQYLMGGEDSQ